jgi:hypothetical protein
MLTAALRGKRRDTGRPSEHFAKRQGQKSALKAFSFLKKSLGRHFRRLAFS